MPQFIYFVCVSSTILSTLAFISTPFFPRILRVKQESGFVSFASSETFVPVLNTTSYLKFEGANEISNYAMAGVNGKSTKDLFIPSALKTSDKTKVWQWWKDKKRKEAELNAAIISTKTDIRENFEDFKPYLAIEKADIMQANANFLSAMSEGNMDMMRSIWFKSNDTFCQQSGSQDAVAGFEGIMDQWENSFLATSRITQFQPRDLRLAFYGDVAMVTCVLETGQQSKNRGRSGPRGGRSEFSQITNIFVRPPDSDRYQLAVHMGSRILDPRDRRSAQLRETYRDPTRPKARKGNGQDFGALQQILGGDQSQDDDDDDSSDDDFGQPGETSITLRLDDGDNDGDNDVSDDDETDDEDDTDDGFKREKKAGLTVAEAFNSRLRNSLSRVVQKLAGGGGQRVVMGNGRGMLILGANSLGNLGNFNLNQQDGTSASSTQRKGGGKSRDDDDDEDEDDDDDDDEDDEDDGDSKKLAARTLLALQWLHANDRISSDEKQILTSNIINSATSGSLSETEVAFSLLIGAGTREKDSTAMHFDMAEIEPEDIQEFEDLCHVISKRLKREDSL